MNFVKTITEVFIIMLLKQFNYNLCMYVCINVCIYMCMCVYVRTYVYVYTYVFMYVCVCICAYVCVCVRMCVYKHVLVFLITLTPHCHSFFTWNINLKIKCKYD